MRLLSPRILLGVVLLVYLGMVARLIVESLSPELLCFRDFQQDHLQARAVRMGFHPLLPTNELARRFTDGGCGDRFSHGSPHFPGQFLLTFPLSYLGAQGSAIAWLCVSVVCFLAVGVLISQTVSRFVRHQIGWLVPLVVITARPVWLDLVLGQSGSIVLLLGLVAVMSFTRERFITAGMLLGLSLAIKPLLWPFALFALLKRQFSLVVAACLAWCFVQMISIPFLGLDTLWRIYFEVGPEVARHWRFYDYNLSLASLVSKAVLSLKSFVPPSWQLFPLLTPDIAVRIGSLVGGAACLLVVLASVRVRRRNLGLAMALCVSPIALPVGWIHYLSLLIIPLYLIMLEGEWRGLPKTVAVVGGVATLLWWGGDLLGAILKSLFGNIGGIEVLIYPLIIVPMLCYVIIKLDRADAASASSP